MYFSTITYFVLSSGREDNKLKKGKKKEKGKRGKKHKEQYITNKINKEYTIKDKPVRTA